MPSKSLAQHEAMCAASKGKSTTGIPKSVGEEFCHADKGRHFSRGGFVGSDIVPQRLPAFMRRNYG